ncbi:PaaI family thioesterase [Candidatus Chlorohelix sp.]|uniref:PaaI family thioesterase n=1 Tax=Candidatus Chlorohelix sp. TaxID=3139201 RepID=UPI00305E9396
MINNLESGEVSRQPASDFCFVCGRNNPAGLRLDFYNNKTQVWTEFTPTEYYQSWPGILHGGIITTLLDETISRVAFLYDKWVSTGKLEVKFRKPTPLGQKLRISGELVRDAGRAMEMRGRIQVIETGEITAEASGLFVRLPDATRHEIIKAVGGDFAEWEEWLAKNRH